LKFLVRVYKPNIIYLFWTITTSIKTKELRYRLGFDFCFTVNRQGRSGGLVLF